MSQPVPQSSKKTVPLLQPNDPTMGTFWHSFTVFLLPLEKFCARRWYIFGIAFFAVDFVTALVRDLAIGSQHHDIWMYFREEHFRFSFFYAVFFKSLFYNAYFAGMFLALGLFNRWQQSIPLFFQALEQRCHVTDPQLGTEKS